MFFVSQVISLNLDFKVKVYPFAKWLKQAIEFNVLIRILIPTDKNRKKYVVFLKLIINDVIYPIHSQNYFTRQKQKTNRFIVNFNVDFCRHFRITSTIIFPMFFRFFRLILRFCWCQVSVLYKYILVITVYSVHIQKNHIKEYRIRIGVHNITLISKGSGTQFRITQQ